MTDNAFQKLLNRVTIAHGKYLELLSQAEEEYKERFGNYPGEVDDDFFIDSFCQAATGAKVEDVIKNAILSNDL